MRRTVLRAAPRNARGFSLLELMLVIAIIAVLSAVVAYNVGGAGAKAKRRATITSMNVIKGALEQYNLDHSTYPPTLATLVTAKILDPGQKLEDGWSTPYFYSPTGLNDKEAYTLLSLGDDKTASTPDDISVWTMNLTK